MITLPHHKLQKLGVSPRDARLFMVYDGRHKTMYAEGGMRPMLLDLREDPEEFHVLAKGSEHNKVIDKLYLDLCNWGLRMSQCVTKSESDIIAMRGLSLRRGILSFLVDGSEVPDELTEKYRGAIRQDHTKD